MVLREFLYVDTDKVRGMLAQLDGGVFEEERETTRDDKRSQAGVSRFVQHYQTWGSERLTQKSLGDALFPTLEEALESEGILQDVSQELSDVNYWTQERLRTELPPGTVVRITTQGSMFDARYVAATFTAFATAYSGLQGIGAVPQVPAAAGKGGKRQQPQKRTSAATPGTSQLEDAVPDLDLDEAAVGFGSNLLRSLIRVSRGVFAPGLHLNLFPTDDDRYTVGARLQEGRRFLDGDPDVLFARYGVGKQEWTLVGTIGHYADAAGATPPSTPDLVDDDGDVRRARSATFVNAFMGTLGARGFIDLPQSPGFSVVPLAVYRVTPNMHLTAVALPAAVTNEPTSSDA